MSSTSTKDVDVDVDVSIEGNDNDVSNGDDSATLNIKNNANVHLAKHPILAHKITILRSSATHSATFRAVLKEITYHLGYEATRSLSTKPVNISVPIVVHKKTLSADDKQKEQQHADWVGSKLKERIALIPILRSGLGMVDSMMELIPTSEVHHIGMYKSTIQDHPVLYYNKLPKHCHADVAYILDPCIATASTIKSVVTMLKKWGVLKIHVLCVIGSTSGLQTLMDEHPDIEITVGTIDSYVTPDGDLLPGLGDSGDRLFGTSKDDNDDDDQSLVHHSKRKRTYSQAD